MPRPRASQQLDDYHLARSRWWQRLYCFLQMGWHDYVHLVSYPDVGQEGTVESALLCRRCGLVHNHKISWTAAAGPCDSSSIGLKGFGGWLGIVPKHRVASMEVYLTMFNPSG